ncbi:hypothetical protein ABZ128_22375 [Streptomyces sp. NPDC006326]|uniref:hypothetical protein n=1 Tax=Streptomyces sp. NPDC006326 TaxID=3156752 RepID=UPI0033BEF1D9
MTCAEARPYAGAVAWPARHRVPLAATAAAAPLYAVWGAVLATGGGDLAAQEAWAGFVTLHPGAPYNLSWHGGLHTAGYSVLSPYAMAALGVRPVSVACGLGATWLAGMLCVRSGLRRPLAPALTLALVLWCQVASGRTTFMLGVVFACGALVVLLSGRSSAAVVVCAALAGLASPVAGLFLGVVGAGRLLTGRWGQAAALAAPPAAVLGLAAWLFPFGGEQPMDFVRVWPPLVMTLAAVAAAPPAWRTVRRAGAVYAVGVLLAYAVPSPVGTNIERLAHLAAPAVLVAALPARGARTVAARRLACTAVLALGLAWVGGNTAAHLRDTAAVPAWAADTDGVVRALERLGADRTRVEVVMARSHREAAVLAPRLTLARGWNRQADVERGPLFYGASEALTPRAYRAWLDRWAVGFVAVHGGALDGASEPEYRLVSSRPDYLEPVWRDANWQVYRVRSAVPLVDPPASVVRADGAEVVVHMPTAGTVTLRIVHSPWLRADAGCLERAGGSGLTRLTASGPGDITIGSSYTGGRARPCAA